MKKIIIIFLLLGLCLPAFSQINYEFIVLGSKGSNTVNGNTIKVGMPLKKGQKIFVDEYLGLAHKTGKTLEIKISGNFTINKLVEKIQLTDNSLLHNYASFVINELKPDKLSNRYNKKQKTGAVYRAVKNRPVAFMLPEKTIVYPDNITIVWSSIDTVKNYKLEVLNMMQEVIYSKVVNDTTITINLKDIDITSKINLIYQIKDLKGKLISGRQMFSLIGKDTKKLVKEDLKVVSSDNIEINYINEALIYEEYGLYANALDSYQKAIKVSNSEFTISIYKAFLKRNEFIKN